MNSVLKYKRIFSINSATGGGSGSVNSVNSGTSITVDNTDPANPIVNFTGTLPNPITVVTNYSALPVVGTVTGKFYWCSASQGTKWLPFSLGGTYYSAGLYYSNGVNWEFMDVPYQATQAAVNAGIITDQFVSPATLANYSGLSNYVPLSGTLPGKELTGTIVTTTSGLPLFSNGEYYLYSANDIPSNSPSTYTYLRLNEGNNLDLVTHSDSGSEASIKFNGGGTTGTGVILFQRISTGKNVTLNFTSAGVSSISSNNTGYAGWTYGADYSANFGLRSLVDKEYTDTKLALKAPLTSPALVTPDLGTPSAGVLTNATGYTLANLVGAAWVDWSASDSLTGFSSTTIHANRYIKIGRLVIHYIEVSGTSNATTITMVNPFTSITQTDVFVYLGAMVTNGGTTSTVAGGVLIGSNTTSLSLLRDRNSTAWTNTGVKTWAGFVIYESTT